MSPFEEIKEKDWQALLEGMVGHQYHLLVGAGINTDCTGGDGKPIPNSSVLANQLITDFGLKTDGEDVDLKRAYENIAELRDQHRRNRNQYFKARFSSCTPSWQGLIFNLGWRRIWTLNVDDVLENAFDKYVAETKSQRKYSRYTWNDLFAELGRENDNVQIVHLHGFADGTDNLIFSIAEYLKTITTRKGWHPVFGDEYQGEPFIIIGAKLRDEIDLYESIRLGNKSRELLGRPSIIILKDITEFQRTEFIKFGLVPVRSDAKTFIEKLIPDVINLEKKVVKVVPGSYLELPFEARVFLEQFRLLRTNKEEQITPFGHDFYAGYEPYWADILNDYDVRFESVENIYQELVPIINGDTDQRIYYFSGDPGSGKSAILLRIARDLIALGKDVFLFRGDEVPNINSIVWWLKHSANTILLFDNIADFLTEVGQLCEVCRKEKIKLNIVATERASREGVIIDELEYTFLQKYKKTHLGRLSDSDINKLIEKLKTQGRLGKITRKFIGEQRYYFQKTSNRQLFPAMADLEGGLGFIRRIAKEYREDIKSQELKHVYALVCIAHSLGYALPIGILSAAVGIPAKKITDEVSSGGQLFRIVVLAPKGLKARHRVVASNIVEKVFDDKERFELVKTLAIHLSPHISTSAILQKTLYYRIIKELMDERIILDWLNHELAQRFYADLRPYYDWDARYWEQRALAESRMNHLEPAMSYAETAVERSRDPFTLNTLGTVLLRTASNPDYSGAAGTLDLYWKGVGNLHESLDVGHGQFPHPYTTFFTHTLSYVQLHFKHQELDRNIIKEWEWWYKRAQSSPFYSSPEKYKQLSGYNISWLKLATQGSIEE